jgi:hypothetical protein
MTHHLVGSAEAARILGVSRQRVAQLAVTDGFPEPEVVLSGGRIWRREDIESWAARNQERGPGRSVESDEGWALHRLTRLATEEATTAGHAHLGCEHVVVAMLRPESPGVARQVLESFGLTIDSTRQRLRDIGGPPDPEARGQMYTPALQMTLERARLEAERLSDDVVSSHHVLLAMANDPAGTGRLDWVVPGTPMEWIRQRTLALSDSPADDEAPDADFVRRKAKSRRVNQAKGMHKLPGYLPRSDGVDPQSREPWGSMGLFNEPWYTPGMPIQYTVDCDGVPVLGPTGRLFAITVDDEGFMVLDEQDFLRQEEFDLPEGASVEWPDGFGPPPGAAPGL